ncbi:efflux RND transporter periplasmic adaptor subunit [Basilea psittacipulmonis]|uniref:efflux RND transporter periplasmic adaptor subunit n=1 Tax=Basilea psittacipulmonis TaxID=1472345 RepID=UPI00068B50ED|nr:efflux RND transporter periplasmic adaptor subunit [Basilea psittacipulmonis]
MRSYIHKRLLLTTFCSALALAGCSDNTAKQQMPAMPVNVVIVQPKSVSLYTDYPARIKAIESAEVRARVTGTIKSVNYEQGSQVTAGQSLFTIDPAVYQAQFDAAKAAVAQAQATFDNADLVLKRYTKLVKLNAVSKQDFDTAKANQASALASLESAKASLEQARINLEYTEVQSPIDGVTDMAEVVVGTLVSSSSSTLLTTVQNASKVYADFTEDADLTVYWNQLSKTLKLPEDGLPEVTILNDAQSKGKLIFTGSNIDTSTGQVNKRALFDNSDKALLPGMFVTVRLNHGIAENALLVPVRALQGSTDEHHAKLYLVNAQDKKVSIVDVTVSQQQDGQAIITSGIKAGDMVMVDGFDKTAPGATVTPIPLNAKPQSGDAQTSGEQQ